MTIIAANSGTITICTDLGHRISLELPTKLYAFVACLAGNNGNVVSFAQVYCAVFKKEANFGPKAYQCGERRRLSNAMQRIGKRLANQPIDICRHPDGYRIVPELEVHVPRGTELAKSFLVGAIDERRAALLTLVNEMVRKHLDDEADAARQLSRTFCVNVPERALISLSNASLGRLLLVGLPACADHCMTPSYEFLRDHAERLLDDARLCQLLCGVRLTELSYTAAYDYLCEASRGQRQCARFAYVFGQTARKLEEFAVADATFEKAARQIQKWPGEVCRCALQCQKADLLSNVYRGRGVVARGHDEWERADDYFRTGSDFVGGASLPHQADFWFSYGYMKYQEAWRNSGMVDTKALQRALEYFGNAIAANPDWAAPVLRMAIIELAQNERIRAHEHLSRAWVLASQEDGVEALFAATNAAFALAWLGDRDSRWVEQAERSLQKAFEKQLVVPSIRRCHAFDNARIATLLASGTHARLGRISKLFEMTTDWSPRSLEEQKSKVASVLGAGSH